MSETRSLIKQILEGDAPSTVHTKLNLLYKWMDEWMNKKESIMEEIEMKIKLKYM